MYAFGGNFNPGVTTAPRLKLGNPTPMGLFAFASTTLILSFINAGSRGVENHNIVLSCAIFYGGMVQIIAGIWELVVENMWGATVFTAYGGYWISFATITMDGFNIASSYTDEKEYSNAMGLFLLVWAIVTAFFTVCTLRSTIAMFSLLFFVTLTFTTLACEQFTAANGTETVSANFRIAGGVFGCIASMLAYYNAMAGLMNRGNSWIDVRPFYMPGAIRPPPKDKSRDA